MMRVALMGGIYSNWRALETALSDISRRQVDRIFCLGDLGAFGPYPDRVFPLLQASGVLCLQGNYDNSLAGGLADCQCGYTDPRDNYFARLSYDYTFRNTSPAHKAWLGTLPMSRRLDVNGTRLLLCHGRRAESTSSYGNPPARTGSSRICSTRLVSTCCASRTLASSGIAILGTGVTSSTSGRSVDRKTTARRWCGTRCSQSVARVDVEFVPIQYDHEALAADMRAERLADEFIETILSGRWTTCLEVLPQKERGRGRF